mgnify:CR=1 FL=1
MLKFDEILRLISEVLTSALPDSSMRLVDNLYATAGFDDVETKTYQCVLLEDDGEDRTWRRVIDSLNIACNECLNRINEEWLEITREQLIDVTARGIAQYLSLTRYTPELQELDQYRYDMRTKEIQPIEVNPEIKAVVTESNEAKIDQESQLFAR